jgi:hypothetical protein
MDHGNAGCIISAVKIDTFRKCFENIASPSEVAIRRNKMDQIAATGTGKLALVFAPDYQKDQEVQIIWGKESLDLSFESGLWDFC